MTCTATYSPEDNKLRLYPVSRLDTETYATVKAAGFAYAPKQGLFVAPMWTPYREDFLLQLCGEIGDEDTSLVERAEEREERFENYSEKRNAEAEQAHRTVKQICDGIPLGQPILVGHHSEGRARRDAARIENGMRNAVRLWDTASYWQDRAQSAIRHAKYKERPDVRARRIKTLEADKRKQERTIAESTEYQNDWKQDGLTDDQAKDTANLDHIYRCFPQSEYPASKYDELRSLWSALEEGLIDAAQAAQIAIPIHSRKIAFATRWVNHIANRLTYERAMLAEGGGTKADQIKPEKGGACRCWASPRGGWSYIQKVNKVSVTVLETYSNGGRVFTRIMPFDKLVGLMSAETVESKRRAGFLIEAADGISFFVAPTSPFQTEEPTTEPASDPETSLQDV